VQSNSGNNNAVATSSSNESTTVKEDIGCSGTSSLATSTPVVSTDQVDFLLSENKQTKKRNIYFGLGVGQVIQGSLFIAIETILCVIHVHASQSAFGIWCGLLFLGGGCIAITVGKKPKFCPAVDPLLVVTSLSAITSLTYTTIRSIQIVKDIHKDYNLVKNALLEIILAVCAAVEFILASITIVMCWKSIKKPCRNRNKVLADEKSLLED